MTEELLTKIEAILSGIDKCKGVDPQGWWETSTGTAFGAERLRLVREAFEDFEECLRMDQRWDDGSANC